MQWCSCSFCVREVMGDRKLERGGRGGRKGGVALFQEGEEDGEDEAEEGGDVVPVDGFALEDEGDDDGRGRRSGRSRCGWRGR